MAAEKQPAVLQEDEQSSGTASVDVQRHGHTSYIDRLSDGLKKNVYMPLLERAQERHLDIRADLEPIAYLLQHPKVREFLRVLYEAKRFRAVFESLLPLIMRAPASAYPEKRDDRGFAHEWWTGGLMQHYTYMYLCAQSALCNQWRKNRLSIEEVVNGIFLHDLHKILVFEPSQLQGNSMYLWGLSGDPLYVHEGLSKMRSTSQIIEDLIADTSKDGEGRSCTLTQEERELVRWQGKGRDNTYKRLRRPLIASIHEIDREAVEFSRQCCAGKPWTGGQHRCGCNAVMIPRIPNYADTDIYREKPHYRCPRPPGQRSKNCSKGLQLDGVTGQKNNGAFVHFLEQTFPVSITPPTLPTRTGERPSPP